MSRFYRVQKGVADRADCVIYLRSEAWRRGLQCDPRYLDFVRRIGFPER